MNKYFIIFTSTVLFFAIAAVVFFNFIYTGKKDEPSLVQTATSTRREIPEPNIKIGKYLLGGEVTAVKNNEISVTLKRLFAGDNGNYMDTDNKLVKVSSSTVIVIGKSINKKYSEIPANFSDIKTGQKLTFYSGENIKIMPVFSPYKIVINQ